jgi:hypothetical protein
LVVSSLLLQELPNAAVRYGKLHEETEQHMAQLREKEDALVRTRSRG